MLIGFIGSGKMATAIMKSLISNGVMKPSDIIASDIIPDALQAVSTLGIKITKSNIEVVENSDVVVLSVKSQDIPIVVNEIAPFIENKLVVSIAAGVTIGFLEKSLPTSRVVRVMPNLALLTGEGMSVVARKSTATKEDVEKVVKIFRLGGKAIEIDEELIDAATAVSGSGPAYFFRMIENISEAGKRLGLDKKLAVELTAQTCIGAGKVVLESEKEVTDLISMVASKGGTTEAALAVLDKENFDNIVFNAVVAAGKKARELNMK